MHIVPTEEEYRGARFVEPSIYSMDHPATAQAVYSTAFGHFMRPGEISVRNTSKGIRTEPLRLKHHQWLYDGVYPAGHEVEGQIIVVGQSINLPRASPTSLANVATGRLALSPIYRCARYRIQCGTSTCARTVGRTSPGSLPLRGRARC